MAAFQVIEITLFGDEYQEQGIFNFPDWGSPMPELVVASLLNNYALKSEG